MENSTLQKCRTILAAGWLPIIYNKENGYCIVVGLTPKGDQVIASEEDQDTIKQVLEEAEDHNYCAYSESAIEDYKVVKAISRNLDVAETLKKIEVGDKVYVIDNEGWRDNDQKPGIYKVQMEMDSAFDFGIWEKDEDDYHYVNAQYIIPYYDGMEFDGEAVETDADHVVINGKKYLKKSIVDLLNPMS